MKERLGVFLMREMATLSAFGKFAASLNPGDRTDEEWLDVYLTFRKEHAERNSNDMR